MRIQQQKAIYSPQMSRLSLENIPDIIKIFRNKRQIPNTLLLKKTLWPLFLWMGFNCLKATATSTRQFTFYHSVPRNSWYSSWTSQKYKQDSKKKHVSSIRKRFLPNVDENKQECFSLRLVLKEKFTDGEKSVKAQLCAR